MAKDIMEDATRRMSKTLEAAGKDYATIRTGRANPMLLDSIKVDYYGSLTPLNQLAGISVPEPRQLLIAPFDKSSLDNVLKALQSSDMGFNPSSDGSVIRINIPPLNQERRKELTKILHKKAESHKVAIRNIRRDVNEAIKAQQKSSEITEDDAKQMQNQIQKDTDKFIADLDKLTSKKEAELNEI